MAEHAYHRYEVASTFGIVASPKCGSICLLSKEIITSNNNNQAKTGLPLVLVSAGVFLQAWDLAASKVAKRFEPRRSTKTGQLVLEDGSITCAIMAKDYLIAGRERGRIDVWDVRDTLSTAPKASMVGHWGDVLCLDGDDEGVRLVSGGRDTYVVVWDLITETALFRLRGHKDRITSVKFIPGLAVSASKDGTVKTWNLETRVCESTLVDHKLPVWGCDVSKVEGAALRCVTGSSDGLLRSFTFDDVTKSWCLMGGAIGRQTTERAQRVEYTLENDLVCVTSYGRVVEFYRVRSPEEVKKKMARRLRRLKEKLAAGKEVAEEDASPHTTDEFELACALRVSAPLLGVTFGKRRVVARGSTSREVFVSYTNNLVEVYELKIASNQDEEDEDDAEDENKGVKRVKKQSSKSKSEISLKHTLESLGHRTDVRASCLSLDSSLLLTAAEGAVKLWNVDTEQCARTFLCGWCLCVRFLPGDTRAICGQKDGSLVIFDLKSGSVAKTFETAHDGAIYGMDLRRDGKALVTVSADQSVKTWAIGADGSVTHARTLKLGEEAQSVKYISNKFICVSVLDSTTKVFHEDSFDFALSLYGHKLPVLAMDGTSDGTLLVTASADKSIKSWGLDFGDCHNTFSNAHQGSVTCLKTIPKTHYCVSSGRDGAVKYWDLDRRQMIASWESFHPMKDVWSLSLSTNGSMFVTAGKDGGIRVWERSEDLILASEENDAARERELERQEEEEAVARELGGRRARAIEEVPEHEGAVSLKRTTLEASEALDLLLDALDSSGKDADDFLAVLKGFSPSDLEQALHELPFARVSDALNILLSSLRSKREIELCIKCILSLISLHFPTLTALGSGSQELKRVLQALSTESRGRLSELKHDVGLNAAGLKALANAFKSDEEAKKDVSFLP